MREIVRVKNLKKSFGKTKAMDGVTFSVKKGGIFGLIGPDGAGKTTTLRVLSGIMDADSGGVSVLGINLPAGAENVKERIGYMPQKFSLYTDLTVRENVDFFAEVFGIGKKILEKRLKPVLSMTGLGPFKDRLAGNLSGGMKQKLALMVTLIHRPELLILDEPTTGVDPVSRREFWEILQEILSEGVSIIVSTPYMDEAEWCTDIGLMFKGKMIKKGGPAALKKEFKGTAVEITAKGNAMETAGIISGVKGVRDVQEAGGKFRAIIDDNKVIPGVKKALKKPSGIRKAEVSMEDIFVSAMGGAK